MIRNVKGNKKMSSRSAPKRTGAWTCQKAKESALGSWPKTETACPSAWANLVGTTIYKWSGNGNGGKIRTLYYARLVCPLWQSCKAMLARIEQLEQRVAQLSAAEGKAWAPLRSKRSAA